MNQNDKVKTITYLPGEFILREGAKCDSLFIVKTGQVQIYRLDSRKNKIVMGMVQSGEYLGEMALLSSKPHSANAVALTRTECVKLSSHVLEEELKKVPKWLSALTRGLVFKLNRTNEVLRRNGINDESLTTAIRAIQDKEKAA